MVIQQFYCYFIKLAANVRKVNTELSVLPSCDVSCVLSCACCA